MSEKKEKEDEKRKKEEADEAARRSGSIKAEDLELAEWITRQWKNREHLNELDIVQSFGTGRNLTFGLILDKESFSPSTTIDQEAAAGLCNRFFLAAVRDCTRVLRKPANYYVRAWCESRGADPVDSFPLYITPRTTALTRREPSGSERDEDEQLTAEKLALAYASKLMEANQFDRSHISSTFGDIILIFRDELREMRQDHRDLMGQNKDMFVEVMAALRAREEALATAEDRMAHREMMKLKIELIKDGIYTGRNLLTGLFGKVMAARASDPTNGTGGSGGTPKSEEQTLLHTFFQDCKASGLEAKLFGDWKKNEQTGMMECSSPGIFTPDQFKLIVSVYRGDLSPEALDELDPESGRPLAVTFGQVQAAQNAMPMKMSGLMLQLFDLRKRKRNEAAAAAASATATATDTETATAVPPTEGHDDV